MPLHGQLQRPAVPGTPALVPLGQHAGKPAIPLNRSITTVGSRHDAHLHLLSRSVSKAHALIVAAAGRHYIRDLSSRTHLYVNGQAVREEVLVDGDLLKVGTFTFRYSSDSLTPASPAGEAPAAHMEVDGADLPVPIADKVLLIGRRPTSDIALVESSVSTAHAAIVEIDGRRFLRDLGSRTGSFVNGKRVRQVELSFGDQIRIGETEMRYTPVELSLGVAEEPAEIAPPESVIDVAAVESDENAVAPPTEEQPAISVDTGDQPQRLLVDADLRQEKLSSSATHTELQAEADQAIASAGQVEPDIADLLAVDHAPSETASPTEEDLLPESDDEFEPRRGWRGKRALEAVEPAAEVPAAAETPVEPVAAAVDVPVADETAPAADVVEDDVFRIPNEDDLRDSAGGTAVLDEPPVEADELRAPFEPVVADETEIEPEHDLGLSPRLAEMAAAPVETEPPALDEPVPAEIDFSALNFEVAEAADDVQTVETGVDEAFEPANEKPLLDLSVAPREVEARPEPVTPLIAPGAFVEPPPEVIEPPISPTPSRRRASRRKKKIDSTVIASAPAAEPPPVIEPPVIEPPVEVVEPVAEPIVAPAEEIVFIPEPLAEEIPALPDEQPLPALDLTDVDAGAAEVLDSTEPTPASALDLSDAEIEAELEAQTLAAPGLEPELTDTSFGRDVEDFTGESTGPLVEEPAADLQAQAEQESQSVSYEPPPQETLPLQPSAEAPPSFEAPAEELPSLPPLPSFGADQAGFLGGSPLKLGNLTPPPRPKRLGAPFGRKPLVPSADAGDEIGLPSGAFARGPFDVTPDDVPAGDQTPVIPPYTGRSATTGQVTTGFDGLAMPPVRQMDVFSQMFPSAEDEQILSRSGGSVDLVVPESNASQAAGRKSPASALDAPSEDFWSADAEQAVDAARRAEPAVAPTQEAPRQREHRPPSRPMSATQTVEPPRRRKRWWSIRSLLVLMLLSMILAAGGVYYLVPVRTLIVGTLKFSNFDQLPLLDQQEIERRQKELLQDPELRRMAQNLFERDHPRAQAGFLAQPERFAAAVAEVRWPENADALSIHYAGQDSDVNADVQRVAALVNALYNRNAGLTDTRNRVQADVDRLERAVAATEQEVSKLQAETERLKPLFENRPTAARLAELQGKLEEREKAWNQAVSAVTHLKLEVEAMQRAAGIVPSTQPATTQPTEKITPENDPRIAELKQSLSEATTKLEQQKQADAELAGRARAELDAALEQFQSELVAASQTPQNSPELQAYLDEAQALQQSMRKLTVELIDRQQEQHARLTDLKQRLDEKLTQRRSDAWQNDPQLREFSERLEMTRRSYNAALANDLTGEAEELQAKVKLLEEMVKSRQELIGQDTLLSDTIKQLEEMIAQTEKQLADDRKASEEMIARLETSFSKNQSGKLPAEQQALASELEQRVAALAAARARYADAISQSAGGVDVKQLEAVVADLRSKVEIRSAEIDRQNSPATAAENAPLDQRQAELAAARQSETAAQEAYFAVHNEYQQLQADAAQARAAGDRLDETIRELDVKKGELTQQQNQLEAKNRELARAVAPIAPDAEAVKAGPVHDPRAMITLASWGGIALLFVVLISLTSAGGAEPPVAALATTAGIAADSDEIKGAQEAATSNGNANGQASDHAVPRRSPLLDPTSPEVSRA